MRTLFALARGLCILTEEWVYQSVSQEAWAETSQFLHPRYNLYSEERGFRRAIDVFRGKKILVLDSISPPTEVLVDLVVAAGGKTTAMVDEDGISFVVFGKSHVLTCVLPRRKLFLLTASSQMCCTASIVCYHRCS